MMMMMRMMREAVDATDEHTAEAVVHRCAYGGADEEGGQVEKAE